MGTRNTFAGAVVAWLTFASSPAGASEWLDWTPDLFERARAEKRFILLDLEAVWCHWCHEMRRQTYADPRVQDLIDRHYLAVRVDQDANPDLSNRYGDWGWPATIVLAPEGTEIVIRQGFLPPVFMADLLQAIVDDPSPGPSIRAKLDVEPAPTGALGSEKRLVLENAFLKSYDGENGGWGTLHKFIDADSMDYVLSVTELGDERAATMARKTLTASRLLIDPVWGGVYQYSDRDDWRSPHYEKIMFYQASNLRHYANAYALWRDKSDLEAAQAVAKYLYRFLTSPEGAFYTSQDADVAPDFLGEAFYALSDAERRALGRQPRIDTHVYARENGWAISGLVAYSNATGDTNALERAAKAADWVLANRRIVSGGFSHGDKDSRGPFLGDSLAMGRALLDLYGATGDRRWLREAALTAHFIRSTFLLAGGGFMTAKASATSAGVFAEPVREMDEQVGAARFFNLIHRHIADPALREAAEHAGRYLAADAHLERGFPFPGILLAMREVEQEPTHITIVGRKDDPAAARLYAEGRRHPALYKRLDWWDKREGDLPNADVTYPELEQAAAFVCTHRICSLPTFTPDELAATLEKVRRVGANGAAPRG